MTIAVNETSNAKDLEHFMKDVHLKGLDAARRPIITETSPY
jgi:hypothetical protein